MRLLHQTLGFGLEAHRLNGRRWRPDENDARICALLRKSFIFRQEAVARVDGLRAGALGNF